MPLSNSNSTTRQTTPCSTPIYKPLYGHHLRRTTPNLQKSLSVSRSTSITYPSNPVRYILFEQHLHRTSSGALSRNFPPARIVARIFQESKSNPLQDIRLTQRQVQGSRSLHCFINQKDLASRGIPQNQ